MAVHVPWVVGLDRRAARPSVVVATDAGARGFAARAARAVCEGPWELADLVILAGRAGFGLLAVVVAWIGCSGTLVWNTQQAWTALAIAGLVLALTGVIGWVGTGVRRVRELRAEVLGPVAARLLGEAEASEEPVAAAWSEAETRARTTHVVLGPGMTHFHRPACILARGKDLRAKPRRQVEKRGVTPCAVCRP